MKWTREQYIELMTFGDAPRPMFSELFGPLVGLDAEWREQGADEREIAMAAFDWDYVPYVDCGGICGAFGTPEPVVLGETSEYVLSRDYLGRTNKLCKATATVPLPLDFPVKTMEDWQALKPYYVYDDRRVDMEAVQLAAALQKSGVLVRADIPGGWDTLRELMGEEQACLAFYLQADTVHDIMDTIRSTSVRVLERVQELLAIDQLSVHEDMAGKSGPLIGPNLITEFVSAHYRACWETVASRGTRLFNQDSDGNMMPVMDVFLDCGVNVMHPLEPAAGMDMVTIRETYGNRLAFLGGIDKHVLRGTKEQIDRELQYKLQPALHRGTVFGLDHRITNGTPLENYRYYVRHGRELLGLPPLDGKTEGWGRMAF